MNCSIKVSRPSIVVKCTFVAPILTVIIEIDASIEEAVKMEWVGGMHAAGAEPLYLISTG